MLLFLHEKQTDIGTKPGEARRRSPREANARISRVMTLEPETDATAPIFKCECLASLTRCLSVGKK